MKFSTLLSAIASTTTFAFAEPIYARAGQPDLAGSEVLPGEEKILELRQANPIYSPDAVPASQAAPVVTTYWEHSQIASGTGTYVQIIVTQTFAAVPEQWPAPGVGSIGYGTLTKNKKNKRDAEPTGR